MFNIFLRSKYIKIKTNPICFQQARSISAKKSLQKKQFSHKIHLPYAKYNPNKCTFITNSQIRLFQQRKDGEYRNYRKLKICISVATLKSHLKDFKNLLMLCLKLQIRQLTKDNLIIIWLIVDGNSCSMKTILLVPIEKVSRYWPSLWINQIFYVSINNTKFLIICINLLKVTRYVQ